MPTLAPRTLLALSAAALTLAALPAQASAHGSPHPVINGPEKLGAVTPSQFRFGLPGVTLECPPPEGSKSCRVTITVRSERRMRFRAGQAKKKHVLGTLSYSVAANREGAKPPPVKLNTVGRRLLARMGSLKAVARFDVFQHETILRDFKLTLNQG